MLSSHNFQVYVRTQISGQIEIGYLNCLRSQALVDHMFALKNVLKIASKFRFKLYKPSKSFYNLANK